jgi:hypothetical protein
MKTILLDKELLQTLYGNSPEGFTEISTDFLSSYPETRQTLFSAYESGNLLSLKRLLHFHGPCFNYLGMPGVTVIFKSFEHLCSRAENHFSVRNDFTKLIEILDESYKLLLIETGYLKKAV